MTTATIDNTPVTETIQDGNSITVPSGEVWKVTVSRYHGNVGSQSHEVRLLVDGVAVYSAGGNAGQSTYGPTGFDMVFVGGQVLTCEYDGGFSSGALYVSGFVVNENYTP